MRTVLYQIWANLYVEYVAKNPISPVEHPGGVGVANELFDGGLESFIVRSDDDLPLRVLAYLRTELHLPVMKPMIASITIQRQYIGMVNPMPRAHPFVRRTFKDAFGRLPTTVSSTCHFLTESMR